MKSCKNVYNLLFALLFPMISCKKQIGTVLSAPVSSITVVNAVAGSNSLLSTFVADSAVSSFYSSSPQIGYQSAAEFSIRSGQSPLIIYQIGDTSKPIFSGNISLSGNGIYSLFFSGVFDNQNPPDTLLVEDSPLAFGLLDSTVGIRFVNLAPGSGDVSVDILGNAPGSEVASLGYKAVSPFKKYGATATVPDPNVGYVFEFRVVGSDSILATFNYAASSIARFKNVTIVFSGESSTNATYPLGTFLINNY